MIKHSIFTLCALGLFQIGSAYSASISFVPTTSTNVAPGGTVTFDIYGSSVNSIVGFSLFLDSSGTGSQFQITSYAINSALWENDGYAVPQSISTTHSSSEMGNLTKDFPNSLAANTQYFLGNATISISGATPSGVYSIGNNTQSAFTDGTQSDFAPESDFFVNVTTAVPEPVATGILITTSLGILVGLRVQRRRV